MEEKFVLKDEDKIPGLFLRNRDEDYGYNLWLEDYLNYMIDKPVSKCFPTSNPIVFKDITELKDTFCYLGQGGRYRHIRSMWEKYLTEQERQYYTDQNFTKTFNVVRLEYEKRKEM